MQSDKLKACPFCGGKAVSWPTPQKPESKHLAFLYVPDVGWRVGCRECRAAFYAKGGSPEHRQEVCEKAWNTRPVPAPKLDEDALRVALEIAYENFEHFSDPSFYAKYIPSLATCESLAHSAIVARKQIEAALASPKAAPKCSDPEHTKACEVCGYGIYMHKCPKADPKTEGDAPIFDPKWIQAAIDDRLPEGCVGNGLPCWEPPQEEADRAKR